MAANAEWLEITWEIAGALFHGRFRESAAASLIGSWSTSLRRAFLALTSVPRKRRFPANGNQDVSGITSSGQDSGMRVKNGMKVGCGFLVLLSFYLPGSISARAQSSGSPKKDREMRAALSDPANSKVMNSPSRSRKAADAWVPEDVDQAVPPVAPGVSCPLAEVLTGAGRRIVELVQNVDRFTATEILTHQSVGRSGRLGRRRTLKFDYLVSMNETKDGYMKVAELRNPNWSLGRFPNHIATTGTPSLVLIFHPRYIGDFQTECEGLGEWDGQPAWLVRFMQRKDRLGHLSRITVYGFSYDMRLRGRAWILKDSLQVARLETDLADLISQVGLRLDHMDVEYRPVAFSRSNVQIWLPSSAELFMDFRGHRFYRKHSFNDFKLFSVETQYQVEEPRQDQPVR
jgi:hypothetical protein